MLLDLEIEDVNHIKLFKLTSQCFDSIVLKDKALKRVPTKTRLKTITILFKGSAETGCYLFLPWRPFGSTVVGCGSIFGQGTPTHCAPVTGRNHEMWPHFDL